MQKSCCYFPVWSNMFSCMHCCTCSSEMTAKCIREEHTHIGKSLPLRIYKGRRQLLQLGKYRQPALLVPGSSDGWKKQWAGSVSQLCFTPLLSGCSTGTLQSRGREHCFSIFSRVFLSLGAADLGYTKRANISTILHKWRSLNMFTWKSMFLWIDLFRSSRQSLKWPEYFCVNSWFLNMVYGLKEME